MFGAAHVVDVLLGKDTDKVRQHGHAGLSVFGIGEGRPAKAWRSAVRQLVVQGCLRVDPERFGALVLTEESRGVLRGEQDVRLREDPVAPRKSKSRGKRSSGADVEIVNIVLWDALRECRQRLAAEHNVPPYVVFHDSTLRHNGERATGRPRRSTGNQRRGSGQANALRRRVSRSDSARWCLTPRIDLGQAKRNPRKAGF